MLLISLENASNEKNIKYIKFSRKTIETKDCSEYSYNKLTLLVKRKRIIPQ